MADALPRHRFEVFIVFVKLSSFTQEEVDRIRRLNNDYHRRAVILTARELEPYRLFERTQQELGMEFRSMLAEDLPSITDQIYFVPRSIAGTSEAPAPPPSLGPRASGGEN